MEEGGHNFPKWIISVRKRKKRNVIMRMAIGFQNVKNK